MSSKNNISITLSSVELAKMSKEQTKQTPTPLTKKRSGEVWARSGNIFHRTSNAPRYEELPVGIYYLQETIGGYILDMMSDKFNFNYKIYGTESDILKRIKRTYLNTKDNLGVVFNGIRGTGKTVTAKQLCNSLEMPVILIGKYSQNAHMFINSIAQNIVVFIDEYEKIYTKEHESDMLTVMDGALNSPFRRVFVLTTNNLYINENLIQRPGRIRYIKTFDGLQPEVIEEVIDDLLKYKNFKKELVEFVSGLELLTIDIVKAVIQEVNIHNESPTKFESVFNAKRLSTKFNLYFVLEKTREEQERDMDNHVYGLEKTVEIAFGVGTNFRNYKPYKNEKFDLSVSEIGHFEIIKPISHSVVLVQFELGNIYNAYQNVIKDALKKMGVKLSKNNSTIYQAKLKIENAYVYNESYQRSNYYNKYNE